MVSLADVANAAHVSKMTVSRVLNYPEQVSPEIIANVQQTIQELGYIQNRAGRALANHRHYNIAFVLLEDTNDIEPYYANLLIYLTDALREANYTLEMRHDRNFDLTNVDGFFVSGMREADLPLLKDLKAPVVIYGTNSDLPAVDVDNYAGTYLATETLYNQGYKPLIYLGLNLSEPFATNRENGYIQAMTDLNQKIEIHHLPNNETQTKNFLLNYHLKPNTGIIAATDRLGLGTVRAGLNQGFQIPNELGIIGFDGIYIHQLADVPLTTVQQPLKKIANHMAQLLFQQINEKQVNSVYVLPVLKYGNTTKKLN